MNKAFKNKNDTILILDDEPQYLDWLMEYLWKQDYKIELTTNLVEALKKLEFIRYRLVILDLSVPVRKDWKIRLGAEGKAYLEYPGLFAAYQARNNGQRSRQVVVYSVHDSPVVRAVTDEIGVQYITKGRPKIFKREIDEILSYDPATGRRMGKSQSK